MEVSQRRFPTHVPFHRFAGYEELFDYIFISYCPLAIINVKHLLIASFRSRLNLIRLTEPLLLEKKLRVQRKNYSTYLPRISTRCRAFKHCRRAKCWCIIDFLSNHCLIRADLKSKEITVLNYFFQLAKVLSDSVG